MSFIERSALARSEAVVIIVVNYHNIITRLAEAVVDIFVIIDNLLIVVLPLIDRASRRDFNGGVVEILVIFRHDGPFLAKQMVKLSSLHVEERPGDVFYHHRRNTLVNALQWS